MDFAKLIEEKRNSAKAIVDLGDTENRDLTEDESKKVDDLISEVEGLQARAERHARINAIVVPEAPARRSAPIGEAPAVHVKQERRYDFVRAILGQLDNRLDGLEAEASQEIARRTGKQPEGFFMPLGREDEKFKKDFGLETRDLSTTTGPGGIFVTQGTPFIDLIRVRTVMNRLGARYQTADGPFDLPRQTGATTGYYVAEGVSVTASNPTLDKVSFNGKDLGALTKVTRKFLKQSGLAAEEFVKADQAKQLAIRSDLACLTGPGTSGAPLGILNNTDIQTASAGLVMGTNGGVMTYAKAVAMKTQVLGANIDPGNLKFLTSVPAAGYLQSTTIVANYPQFISPDGSSLISIPVVSSPQVPSGGTKGSSTTITPVVLGDWSEFLIVTFGGLDVVVNPYTDQASGGVSISSFLTMDCGVLHPAAFAIIPDVSLA